MRLNIKNVRLSFPDIFTATQYKGTGPFSYRASLLVPVGSPQFAEIDAAVNQVAAEKFGARGAAVITVARAGKQGVCWNDGASKECDGYAGNWYLTATRSEEKGRPTLVDRDGVTPLVAADGRPYGGCFVNAIVEVWAQDNNFGQTIRCELLGLMFAEDGPAFAGGAAASVDDFAAFGGTPATPHPFAPVVAPQTTVSHAATEIPTNLATGAQGNGAPPAPAAPSAPPPAPRPAVLHTMTAKAGGAPYESFIANGWTDAQLIADGFML